MAKRSHSQLLQVIAAMRNNGGYATLGQIYSLLDFSMWTTQTPEASVRRIVQENQEFFKILPGLWALTEYRESVLKKFQLDGFDAPAPSKDAKERTQAFTHTYCQGLIVEIGNMYGEETFVPSNDRNKLFTEKPLKEIATLETIYEFTLPTILKQAKTIDVIWFGERQLPSAFCEVEHTTNIKNSLLKFCELQDFHVPFYIVAEERRRTEFADLLTTRSTFRHLHERVIFCNYETLASQHSKMCELAKIETIKPYRRR